MKLVISLIIILFFSLHLYCQSYFQQRLNYNIHVKLNPASHSLSGNLQLVYTNNSPDTLTYIYFHLYPNATLSKTKTAFAIQELQNKNYSFYFTNDSKPGFMDSLAFTVDNQKARFVLLHDSLDIGILYLNKPLLPKNSITIASPFFVSIPYAGIMRMGYLDGLYGITQWYPKPAVFDKYGWHPYPYLDEGEYYGEFGTFNVFITVPANYTVAATGELKTNEELERIKKIENINNTGTYFKDTVSGNKTLHFEQDSIHDFAWFASPYFMIAHDSVVIDNKTIQTWAYYTPHNFNLWADAAKYVSQSVKYYSTIVGAYPFKQCTAVEMPMVCSGGMEYPTITSIGYYRDAGSLYDVILHEVGHNWFYGILASNERNNPWIDEGINTFYENSIQFKKVTESNDWKKLFAMMNQFNFPQTDLLNYFYFSGNARPLGLRSENFNKIQYEVNAYANGSSSWYLMKMYLGEDTFNLAMKNLYRKYSFKHIYPEDIQQAISEVTHKPTAWFFDDYLKTTQRSDYVIKNITSTKDTAYVTVKNKRTPAFPFKLSFYRKDSVTYAAILNGLNGIQTFSIPTNQPFTKAIINDDELFFEHNYGNNLYHPRKILPRLKSPSIKFLGIIDNPQKNEICVYPSSAYNSIDKYMFGLIFYAPQIPYPDFQMRWMPLYSFEKNKLNGSFYVEKNKILNRRIKNIRIYGFAESFSLPENDIRDSWQKYAYGVELPFETIKNLKISNGDIYTRFSYTTFPYKPFHKYWYNNTGFSLNKIFNIYQTSLSADIENSTNYSKLKLNAHLFFPYFKKKGFDMDYFWGVFLYNNSRFGAYNFFLSGTAGIKDYQYNDVFIDRFSTTTNHSLWNQQFILSDGLFTTYVPIQSNRWMTSMRTSFALPIPPPFYFYATIGTYYKAGEAWEGSLKFPWELGFEIRIIKNIFAVYFPLTMSSDLKQLSDLNTTSYFEKVRFMLRFSLANPFKYTDKIPTLL
jgi:hypothetical protein